MLVKSEGDELSEANFVSISNKDLSWYAQYASNFKIICSFEYFFGNIKL
jgi:hypothetical protein